MFADNKETWEDIDWLAFETVPLRREIRAIRRAIGELRREGKAKPWWISMVCADGRFPEKTGHGDERVPIRQVVDALLDEDANSSSPVPNGIGINCTAAKHIPALLHDMNLHVKELCSSPSRPKPWLVVYPNGGDWDHSANNWTAKTDAEASEGDLWAKRLRTIVQPALDSRAWRGLILGGCCKTGPREIAALAKQMKSS